MTLDVVAVVHKRILLAKYYDYIIIHLISLFKKKRLTHVSQGLALQSRLRITPVNESSYYKVDQE